jgi:hypothetical protein
MYADVKSGLGREVRKRMEDNKGNRRVLGRRRRWLKIRKLDAGKCFENVFNKREYL